MLEYLEVIAYFDTLGNITPISFIYHNKQYDVDKVLSSCRKAAMIGGSLGIRYTCRILGKQRYIWFDDYNGKWFIEYDNPITTVSF